MSFVDLMQYSAENIKALKDNDMDHFVQLKVTLVKKCIWILHTCCQLDMGQNSSLCKTKLTCIYTSEKE